MSLRLVGLEALGQAHRSAETAPTDFLEQVRVGRVFFSGLRLAADRQHAVLDGHLDVLRSNAGQRGLDDHVVFAGAYIERQDALCEDAARPLAGPYEAVFEEL